MQTHSDNWKHHNRILKQRGTGTARTAAHTASTPAPGALASGLSASKMNLETASTGTPETVASLNEADETASVASGGSDANEASTTALRGSTEGSTGDS